jgi:hypothetical protein
MIETKQNKNVTIQTEGGHYGPVKVLQSNAGYYLGRDFHPEGEEWTEPGSRESNYYPTLEDAQQALDNDSYLPYQSSELKFMYT